jgi:hypothetical protein
MRVRRSFWAAILAAACLPSLTFAGSIILYNNITGSYPGDVGVAGDYSSTTDYFATVFTATATGAVSQIMVGIENDDATVIPAALYLDNGSGEPGTQLETYMVSVPASMALVTINSLTNPILTSGDTYWLVFGPGAGGMEWAQNDTGADGLPWGGSSPTTLTDARTFFADGIEVTGTSSAPEPGTAVLLAAGVAGLAGLRRTIRRS